MSISTQLRLAQLSGSFGTAAGTIRDTLPKGVMAAVQADDFADTLGVLASAIQRLNGAATFSDATAGVIANTTNLFSAATQTVTIRATDGNAIPSLKFEQDDGNTAADTWEITMLADGTFLWKNDNALKDTQVTMMSLQPNGTATSSVLTPAGIIKLGGEKLQDSAGGNLIKATSAHASDPVITIGAGGGLVTLNSTAGLTGPAGTLNILAVDGQDLLLQSGETAGDLLLLQDAATLSQALTSDYIPLSSSTGEIDTFIDNFTAGSSLINAINSAASGAPAEVNKYVEVIQAGDVADGAASCIINMTTIANITGAVALAISNKQADDVLTVTAGTDWTISAGNAAATATSLQGAIDADAGLTATVVGLYGVKVVQDSAGTYAKQSGQTTGIQVSGGTHSGITIGGNAGSTGADFVGGGDGNRLNAADVPFNLDLSGAEVAKQVDILLNGQLLVSGANEQTAGAETPVIDGVASGADYFFSLVSADSEVDFAFTIEADDVVTCVVR